MNDLKINWFNYVDHIFCINYLPNNRYNSFINKLKNVDIDINEIPISKLTFLYDNNINLFNVKFNDNNDILNKISENINKLIKNDLIYKYEYFKPTFKLSLNIYKMLKIAEYFDYDRILYLEDDIAFINNKNYLINALNSLNELSFDILLGQGAYQFNEINIFNNKDILSFENEYFLKFNNKAVTTYGASLCILTKQGIRKLIKLYESLDYPIGLDMIFNINDFIFDIITVKKPLAIQDYYFNVSNDNLKKINPFINIEEYK